MYWKTEVLYKNYKIKLPLSLRVLLTILLDFFIRCRVRNLQTKEKMQLKCLGVVKARRGSIAIELKKKIVYKSKM